MTHLTVKYKLLNLNTKYLEWHRNPLVRNSGEIYVAIIQVFLNFDRQQQLPYSLSLLKDHVSIDLKIRHLYKW